MDYGAVLQGIIIGGVMINKWTNFLRLAAILVVPIAMVVPQPLRMQRLPKPL